jgi:biotin carboxyl carrier protein
LNPKSVTMYKASVNGKQFQITNDEGSFIVDNEPLNWDVAEISEGYCHIIVDNKSFKAELVRADHATKTFTFKINGRMYSVTLRDKFDQLLEKMGMTNSAAGKVNNIKAPMPGLIVELKVKEGDEVKTGDTLLILEAMKMENSIKSPGDGIVKTVKVKKGASVEKGQVLIEF